MAPRTTLTVNSLLVPAGSIRRISRETGSSGFFLIEQSVEFGLGRTSPEIAVERLAVEFADSIPFEQQSSSDAVPTEGAIIQLGCCAIEVVGGGVRHPHGLFRAAR